MAATDPVTRDQIEDAFTGLLGIPPREADIAIVAEMGNTRRDLAEYIWDHWMGEPDEPSTTTILDDMDGRWGDAA